MIMENKKESILNVLVPFVFGLGIIIYFMLGNYWTVRFHQIYWSTILFGFIIALIWLVSFNVSQVKKAYRIGFTMFFGFIYSYVVLMYFGLDFLTRKANWYFWGTGSILFILFGLYLLLKKQTINTCKN